MLRERVFAAFLAAMLRFSASSTARRVSHALKAARLRARSSAFFPRPRLRTRLLTVLISFPFSFYTHHEHYYSMITLIWWRRRGDAPLVLVRVNTTALYHGYLYYLPFQH